MNTVNDSATEDNELVKELSCIISGRQESIFTSPDTNEKLNAVRPGDVLQIAMDDDGRISEIEVTYQRASGEATRPSPITNFHDRRTIILARVTKVGTKTISITTDGGDYTFKKGGNVSIFDEDKKVKAEAGTFDDIQAGDFVVMRYRESSLQDTVVYK